VRTLVRRAYLDRKVSHGKTRRGSDASAQTTRLTPPLPPTHRTHLTLEACVSGEEGQGGDTVPGWNTRAGSFVIHGPHAGLSSHSSGNDSGHDTRARQQ
jgi:hypothetical protein